MTYAQVEVGKVISDLQRLDVDFEYSDTLLQRVPTTHVAMQPPEYFLLSAKVPGFVHVGSSATIQVQEIRGASYVAVQSVMTVEHMQKQGLRLLSTDEITMQNGYNGVLYTTEFELDGQTYQRLMLFAGTYNNTLWISANYPAASQKLLRNVLLQSLLTARFVE